MSYDSQKAGYGREHIYIVEIDLDYCSLTFGTAPCTAVGTGDAKCYNTITSTKDLPHYTKTTKTYRFCEPRSPHPIGLDAIPSLERVSISPAEIDVGGGLGVRASVRLSFKDHPHSDIGIDKYVTERTYIAMERGTFWTKLRARNPNYQYRPLRVLSGYLVNGVYDPANFQTRYYVIEKMDVSSGSASITGKDPLKLAASNKAQVPKPSTGQLQSAITSSATTATLIPAGIGNAEYPASGKIAIKKEIMSFTRSGDTLTLTRGQNNTTAAAQSANDTVQLCYVKNAQVNVIAKDLLENYAGVSTSFIPATAWQSEVDTWLTGLLDGIIAKPMDVNKVLIELAEAMPHYLWWDERSQQIQLTALKPPPTGADVLSMSANLLEKSVQVTDEKDKRISTVFVNFGQFNPLEKLDEPGNYQQTYARIDTNSISSYGSNEVKVINSRWINSTNKAAALQLAAKIGRRFANIPRAISFDLDPKDSDVWVGQSRAINWRDITDFSGVPKDTVFQITSASEGATSYKYKGLEYVYGPSLPADEGGEEAGVDLIIISVNARNINLRTIYNGLFPTPTAATKAKFVVEAGVIIGSTSAATDSLDTGTWPAGALVTIVNKGYIVGKGGSGGSYGNVGNAGGDAINMNYALTLDNQGIIGGGGGGGGGETDEFADAGGGGGAGDTVGSGGLSRIRAGRTPIALDHGDNGTLLVGGNGGIASYDESGEPHSAMGGKGGDLGANGATGGSGGGAAGKAIAKNGFTLTYTLAGDIRGSVV